MTWSDDIYEQIAEEFTSAFDERDGSFIFFQRSAIDRRYSIQPLKERQAERRQYQAQWQRERAIRAVNTPLSAQAKEEINKRSELRKEQRMVNADYKKLSKRGDGSEYINERDGMNVHFAITAFDDRTKDTYVVDGYILTRENVDHTLYDFLVKMRGASGVGALIERWSRNMSKRLHGGERLITICQDELHQQFEPSGGTNLPSIGRCTSPTDLVCRILLMHYEPAWWAEYKHTKETQP